jgi:hypothetical protein
MLNQDALLPSPFPLISPHLFFLHDRLTLPKMLLCREHVPVSLATWPRQHVAWEDQDHPRALGNATHGSHTQMGSLSTHP